MALIDKIFGRKKTLSDLNKQELRKEEILLGKQRDRLFKRIEEIATAKQKIFQQGATQKSPELRKALEGLPDEMPIVYERDSLMFSVAAIRTDKCSPDTWYLKGDRGNDIFYDSEGVTYLVIS